MAALQLLVIDPLLRVAAPCLVTSQTQPSRCPTKDSKMLELLKDLWDFMKVRKKFWLAPIIIVMLLLGALIVLSQGSAVAPFIYTLF